MPAANILASLLACNQTLTIILTHQLCASSQKDKEEFAINLENSAVVVAPLIPWSIAGATPLSTVGAPMTGMAFACFLYILPLCELVRRTAQQRAAKKAAAEYGVDFFYRDFRPGYREGQNMAREDGLYRQKYCGCILSLDESKFRDKIYKDFEGSLGETRSVL